ncbi:hypothetical protein A9Q98_14870 [Thalassotalea sp. 42_200_T64]|nr:hypothetical protein A9Q98_14870 [Thalassotalea sp. 42_200_T64]
MSVFQPLTQDDIHYANMALDYYHTCLKRNERALDYLVRQRGLSENVIDAFGLGFADRTLYQQLGSDRYTQESVRGALQRFGLIATCGATNGREVLRGCIVFPIKDEFGHLTNAFGRKICDKLRKSSEVYVVANKADDSLFNGEILEKHKRIFLCSSPIEALTLWSLGFEHVVSLLGMQCLSDEQARELCANGVHTVDLLMASTPKSSRCCHLIEQKLKMSGITVHKTLLPKGLDINACHQNNCLLHNAIEQLSGSKES